MKVYPSSKMTAGQTNWPYVVNLGNSIIGVSVLTMPFCFKTCGVILGTVLLLCSAWLTSISCNLLVKAAFASRRRSYQYLAFHAVGQAGKLFVEICMIGLLIGTCVAFYVIMGDLGPAIISKVLGIENTDGLRTGLLVFMAIFISLPLALLKNLDSLSNINAISLGFYAVFVAEVFTAALPNLWSGLWVTKVTYWNPDGIFKSLPIFSLAFACQTQLFVMYDALPEPSLQRMHYITKSAIGMCVSVYLCVGYFGYVAFCDDEVQGDILMNFRPTIFSEAVKFGFVLSVAVSFPLVVFPCRVSIYTLFFGKDHSSHDSISGSVVIPTIHFNLITLAIILGTMTVGILVPNIEFVLAMTGSTMGSMICFIFPAIVFIRVMSMSKSSSNAIAQFVLFLGVTILLASTYVTLNTQVTQLKVSESVIKVAQAENNLAKVLDDNSVEDGRPAERDVRLAEGDPDGDAESRHVVGLDEDKKLEGGAHLIEDKGQNSQDVPDIRQEPPNPQAPADLKGDANPDDTSKEISGRKDNVDTDKKDTDYKDTDKIKDTASVKDTDKEVDDKVKVDDKDKAEKHKDSQGNPKDDKDAGKEAAKDEVNAEAKNLLKELKEQQQEQKLLIKEQKQIIEDLKQHQKDAHGDSADEAAPVQPLQAEVPLQQGVPQQGVPLQGVPQQEVVPKQHVVQQQVVPQQGVPLQQRVPVQQGVQQQVVPQQEVVPQQVVPQEGVPQQQVVEQQVVQQQVVPQQGVLLQQGVPQQGVQQQVVPQQGVPQQVVPQEGVPQQQVVEQQVVPQQGVLLQQGVQQQVVPQQGVPQQVVPQQGVPQQVIVEQQAVPQKQALPANNAQNQVIHQQQPQQPQQQQQQHPQQKQQQQPQQVEGEMASLKQDLNQQLVDVGPGGSLKYIVQPDDSALLHQQHAQDQAQEIIEKAMAQQQNADDNGIQGLQHIEQVQQGLDGNVADLNNKLQDNVALQDQADNAQLPLVKESNILVRAHNRLRNQGRR